jgi:hypothetical protein
VSCSMMTPSANARKNIEKWAGKFNKYSTNRKICCLHFSAS